MTRLHLALPLIPLLLAACTPAEQNATIGALGGAAVGAAVSSDSDKTKGALIGAAVGVAASQLLGPTSTPASASTRTSTATSTSPVSPWAPMTPKPLKRSLKLTLTKDLPW